MHKLLMIPIALSVFLVTMIHVQADIISVAQLASLDQQSSVTFTNIGVSAGSGVTVDLTYTFTANTGLFENDGTRMGIDSPENQGAAASTAFNGNETLTLDISAGNIMGVPSGQILTSLDFGIPKVELVRFGSFRWRLLLDVVIAGGIIHFDCGKSNRSANRRKL